MYESSNPKTKKALKALVAEGRADFFQPGGFFPTKIPTNGSIFVEGPHYPQPHRWYAEVIMQDGKAVKVK